MKGHKPQTDLLRSFLAMKLLHKEFEKDGKGQATLIPEESEDLWHLYNLSMKGDTIKAMTYRKIQKEGSTGTVQTEVKKIQMTVEVKSIEYDAAGNCIRYSGKNCEYLGSGRIGFLK